MIGGLKHTVKTPNPSLRKGRKADATIQHRVCCPGLLRLRLAMALLYLLLTSYASLLCLPANAQDITSNLVGHWKMNDGTGAGTAADEGSGGNDGTLTNMDSASDWVAGQFGGGLDFDGSNDHVAAGASGFDPNANDFTLSMWLYAHANDLENSNSRALFSQSDGTGNGRTWLYIHNTDGNLKQFLDGVAGDSGHTVTLNQWTHVALVHDDSADTVSWYINGAAANVNTSITPDAATGDFQFGVNKTLASGHYDGVLDDVRFYDRALSGTDVAALVTNLPGPVTCDSDYAGVMIYNDDENVLQYCNSTNWIDMGPKEAGGAGTCSSPTGTRGEVGYNFTQGVMQYCNGANWIQIGPAIAGSSPAAQIPTTGLTGYWDFEEGSGSTLNDQVGSKDGTLNNMEAGDWVAGVIGTGLQFDGVDEYVDLGTHPTEETVYSISAWFKTASNTQAIVSRAANAHCDYNPQIRAAATSESGCGGLNATAYNAATQDGEWHHVVFTRDGTDLNAYIDGALDYNDTFTAGAGSSFNGSLARLVFGATYSSASTYGQFFAGTIDEVRTYNVELTPAQILALYEGTGGTSSASSSTCSNPNGPAGEMIYNDDENIMQYCNGSEWIGIR